MSNEEMSSIEEIEKLNPHFRWNWRKTKRNVISQYKKLVTNSFAIGCRGHPGIVQNKRFSYQDIHGADLDVVSLLDGCEGSCSIFNCSPDPITGEWARWLMVPFNYEISTAKLYLDWFSTFTDFDKHYTREDLVMAQDKFRDKIEALEVLVTDKRTQDIYNNLLSSYERLLQGIPHGFELDFKGETYRIGKILPQDFATKAEMKRLGELRVALTAGRHDRKILDQLIYQKIM